MTDPVLWARAFIQFYNPITKQNEPWIARWYQAEMMRDTSQFKAYLNGRRTGKCLPGWIRIHDPITGEYISIEELYKRGKANVITLDESIGTLTTQIDCSVGYNGEKEVFRVTLSNGQTIDATGNHPLYTIYGWKTIDDLTINDYVAIPNHQSYFGNKSLDENIIKFLAYMIGDGTCVGTIRFTQQKNIQLKEMEKIVESFNCILNKDPSRNYDYTIVKKEKEYRHNPRIKNKALEILKQYSLYGTYSSTKHIPKEIFELNKKQISLFLSRLYSTDGWATTSLRSNKQCCEIGYCSNSIQLIKDIGQLLTRYGIKYTIQNKTDKAKQILIYNKQSIKIFATEIGIFGKEKALNEVLQASKEKNDIDSYMPKAINSWIQDEMKKQKITKSKIISFWDNNPKTNDRLRLNTYKLQKWKVKIIANKLNIERLKKISTDDINWVQIRSIQSIGIYKTYDLSVPNFHNFVAENIIVHNTEVMCVEGMYKAATNKNIVVLYATPYESQIRLIFNRLTELYTGSPLLKDTIVSNTKNPFAIKLNNGSRIVGFTTGAKTGSGAASLRGQRADFIYLDEMDIFLKIFK